MLDVILRDKRQRRTEELLTLVRALRTGHFRLTSGLHSDCYMQCVVLFEYPMASEELCASIANMFRGGRVDVVAGPALGGVILAYEVARSLGVRNIFAERENGKMTFRRGFHVNPGERVLVVEDVVKHPSPAPLRRHLINAKIQEQI